MGGGAEGEGLHKSPFVPEGSIISTLDVAAAQVEIFLSVNQFIRLGISLIIKMNSGLRRACDAR
jgi:hypothetical protein